MSSRSVLPSGDGEDVSELGVSGTSVVTPVLDPSADRSQPAGHREGNRNAVLSNV